jgi:hypothetical protein
MDDDSTSVASSAMHELQSAAARRLKESGKVPTAKAEKAFLGLNDLYLEDLTLIAVALSDRSDSDNVISEAHVKDADAMLRVPRNSVINKCLNGAGALAVGAGLDELAAAVREVPASHTAYLIAFAFFIGALSLFGLARLVITVGRKNRRN